MGSLQTRGLIAAASALLAGAALFSGCGKQTAPANSAGKIALRDDMGRTVRLATSAKRVVSLAPSVTEDLFAIGAGDQIVGVTDACDYPPRAQQKPRVGQYSTPDLERIIASRPDLVVVSFGNERTLINTLEKRGLTVYVAHPASVEAILGNLAALGTATGREAGAKSAVGRLRARLAAVASEVVSQPAVPTLLLVGDDPIYTVGRTSFIADALARAGGKNVVNDLSEPFPKLDPEQVLVRDPHAILFPLHGTEAEAAVERLKARSGFRETIAVRKGAVHLLPADPVLRPGPRIVDGIEQMARLLHPAAFPNPQ